MPTGSILLWSKNEVNRVLLIDDKQQRVGTEIFCLTFEKDAWVLGTAMSVIEPEGAVLI